MSSWQEGAVSEAEILILDDDHLFTSTQMDTTGGGGPSFIVTTTAEDATTISSLEQCASDQADQVAVDRLFNVRQITACMASSLEYTTAIMRTPIACVVLFVAAIVLASCAGNPEAICSLSLEGACVGPGQCPTYPEALAEIEAYPMCAPGKSWDRQVLLKECGDVRTILSDDVDGGYELYYGNGDGFTGERIWVHAAFDCVEYRYGRIEVCGIIVSRYCLALDGGHLCRTSCSEG
jgi:hypothetical protein